MKRSNISIDAQDLMSTAQVSAALGVSVATVKRWVDQDILPAQRTAGGHRKLRAADVLRAVREGNLVHGNLDNLVPASTDPLRYRDAFQQAVLKPDVEAIARLIRQASSRLSIDILADDIIAPVMSRLGELWKSGRIDIHHEHRVTEAIVSALFELGGKPVPASQQLPVALGGAPEGDHSILPTLLAKMMLTECGWQAINLGPHTPFSAFRAAIDEYHPKLVWLSVSHVLDQQAFLVGYSEMLRTATSRGAAVAIGGSGLTNELRARMGYTTFGDGLRHLAAFARTLHPPPQRPKRGRPFGT